MKAVIYARYSSENQREESIEGQLRECTAYCKKNDITIVRSYVDRALSAKTDNRPDFQSMIKDSAKGLFDVVLVWIWTALPVTAMTASTIKHSPKSLVSGSCPPRKTFPMAQKELFLNHCWIASTQEAGAVIEWNYLKRTGTERWMHPIIDTT